MAKQSQQFPSLNLKWHQCRRLKRKMRTLIQIEAIALRKDGRP